MRTPLAAILLVLALGLTPMVVSEPAIGAERSEEDPEELMRALVVGNPQVGVVQSDARLAHRLR